MELQLTLNECEERDRERAGLSMIRKSEIAIRMEMTIKLSSHSKLSQPQLVLGSFKVLFSFNKYPRFLARVFMLHHTW